MKTTPHAREIKKKKKLTPCFPFFFLLQNNKTPSKRCPFGQDKSGCPKEVTSWVVDMSEFIKGIDRNHLTTVGEEGELLFFSPLFSGFFLVRVERNRKTKRKNSHVSTS